MTILVGGREVDPAAIAVPPMNFGQHHRWAGHPSHAYECRLAVEEFAARAAPWWERLCRELRDDLPFRTRGDDPALDRLEDLGFPPLDRMLEGYRDELAAVLLWEPEVLLDVLRGPPDRATARYIANSVDDVTVSADEVRCAGIAFERTTDAAEA